MNPQPDAFEAIEQRLEHPKQQVSRGLNLYLELTDPERMGELLLAIETLREKTSAALRELHFVHFARFLPTPDSKGLLVITEFDGELEPYIMDFAASIHEVFSAMLAFVKDAPPLPVHEHPHEFWHFVEKNNRVLGFIEGWPVFSAYPERTVIDLVGQRTGLLPTYVDARAAAVPLADVQGNILHHYRAALAQHFMLRIADAAGARLFLAACLSGDASVIPQVTTATEWTRRPDYFFNIGVTAEGLRALGVAENLLARFPRAFLEGPADANRAERNGDSGDSAPTRWVLGPPGEPVHLFVSLYADASVSLDERSAQLRRAWPVHGLMELAVYDAALLPEGKEHFGYVDGIAQPRIAGVKDSANGDDLQPLASPGEFLLGAEYLNAYGGRSLGAMPRELAENGTFLAVRMMAQDVRAFEQVLSAEAARHGVDPELVAAKLMGRWRNGDPLVLVPERNGKSDAPTVAPEEINRFDFEPTAAHPESTMDFLGTICPAGAHIRRMNPRGARVAGKPYSRRVLRRGMPYEASSGGRTEKGLFGMFMCADLERQYEFLLHTWANGDIAASGIRGTQDPIIGTQSMGGKFIAPRKNGPPLVFELPRLVQTRGSVYLFLPGIRGLRALAAGNSQPTAARVCPVAHASAAPTASPLRRVGFDPVEFDPRDAAFRADPYPIYAQFRRLAPVQKMRKYHNTYWVFTHDLVTEVCLRTDLFLKRPPRTEGPRGLFFLDSPRHEQVREIMNPAFARSIVHARETALQLTDGVLEPLRSLPSFDVVGDFARKIPRDVFMTLFGVPEADWADVDGWLDRMMRYFDRTLPLVKRLRAWEAAMRLNHYLTSLLARCPVHAPSGLAGLTNACGQRHGMSGKEIHLTAQNFAIGGYLSTQFLLATGVYHLLRDGRAAWRTLQDRPNLLPNAVAEMLRFDAPFQMADRFAARDTVLGGVRIPGGAMVVGVFGSANHDDRVFQDPDRFDITRAPSAQAYGFGHGTHYCIGAPLVDIVASVSLQGLMERFPDLRLASAAPDWLDDPYYRSFDHLRVLTR